MSITQGATDIIGGGGYGFGGFGGIAPIGLIGLNTFLGNGAWGRDGFRDGIAGTTVLEQNVSELRKDVQGVSTEVHKIGNEVAGMFAQQNLAFTGEFRNIDNQVCALDKSVMQGNFALSQQMSNFQHAVDRQTCEIKEAVHADGDATRALITQNLIDELRHQNQELRRGRDNREIEINVQNNAVQTQNQLQAQLQSQNQFLASMFNALGDQVNRATNSVVQVGSGLVSGGQSNNQANTKVNS